MERRKTVELCIKLANISIVFNLEIIQKKKQSANFLNFIKMLNLNYKFKLWNLEITDSSTLMKPMLFLILSLLKITMVWPNFFGFWDIPKNYIGVTGLKQMWIGMCDLILTTSIKKTKPKNQNHFSLKTLNQLPSNCDKSLI